MQSMRISLGTGIGKCVSRNEVRITVFRIVRRDATDSNTWENSISDWETPKEFFDYIQSLFGPGIKDI